jgi:hypothetical protein
MDGRELFEKYLPILKSGFMNLFKTPAAYGEIECVGSLTAETFISQRLTNGGGGFVIGFAADYNALLGIAVSMHRNMIAGTSAPPMDETREDVADFFGETLNHINSACTYRFMDASFDLCVPESKENSIFRAPRIYTVSLNVLFRRITLFLTDEKNYSYESVGDVNG